MQPVSNQETTKSTLRKLGEKIVPLVGSFGVQRVINEYVPNIPHGIDCAYPDLLQGTLVGVLNTKTLRLMGWGTQGESSAKISLQILLGALSGAISSALYYGANELAGRNIEDINKEEMAAVQVFGPAVIEPVVEHGLRFLGSKIDACRNRFFNKAVSAPESASYQLMPPVVDSHEAATPGFNKV